MLTFELGVARPTTWAPRLTVRCGTMSKKSSSKKSQLKKSPRNPDPSSEGAALSGQDVPVVGMREPCPCGSGRRYKACHGRAASHAGQTLVARPFEGLSGECDIVAMRELVPAATIELNVLPEYSVRIAGKTVALATVLPLAWPALRRLDGNVFAGLQVNAGSGDASRDVAAALLRALDAEPGTPIAPAGLPDPGPRLQDIIEPSTSMHVTMYDGFDFWVDGADELNAEQTESLERANANLIPTKRLSSVDAAYWCRIGDKTHLRWVLPYAEDDALDAFARLHAAHADGLGDNTRYIGSFRANGLLVPVWDLRAGSDADDVEEAAAAYLKRLEEALAEVAPLTDEQRRARAGVVNRQVTLR